MRAKAQVRLIDLADRTALDLGSFPAPRIRNDSSILRVQQDGARKIDHDELLHAGRPGANKKAGIAISQSRSTELGVTSSIRQSGSCPPHFPPPDDLWFLNQVDYISACRKLP